MSLLNIAAVNKTINAHRCSRRNVLAESVLLVVVPWSTVFRSLTKSITFSSNERKKRRQFQAENVCRAATFNNSYNTNGILNEYESAKCGLTLAFIENQVDYNLAIRLFHAVFYCLLLLLTTIENCYIQTRFTYLFNF